ncbi:MAG: hypothetical protein AB1486_24580 [Planctomycetota bacterium]
MSLNPIRCAGLVLILAPACAAPPHDLSVILDDFSSGVTLQLANESHSGLQGLYSERQRTANIKLLSDDTMRGLVDRLRAEGFDDYARPVAELDSDRDGYSGMIIVALDQRRRAFPLSRAETKSFEETMAFIRMKQAIHELFSQAFALQSIRNPSGLDIFQLEQRRLDERRNRPTREAQPP